VGTSQAIRVSGVEESASRGEKEVKLAAEDFANVYLVPYLGEKAIVVAAGSVDIIARGRVSYVTKTRSIDSVLVKVDKSALGLELTWNF
jgi:bifunctional ADP-heptose synthase (sugar kinase/adenylyltransferase)